MAGLPGSGPVAGSLALPTPDAVPAKRFSKRFPTANQVFAQAFRFRKIQNLDAEKFTTNPPREPTPTAKAGRRCSKSW